MKVTDVKVTVIAIPDPPLRNVNGCHEPYAARNIIQVRTDEGIEGLGEMSGGTRFQEELLAVKEQVVGMDPFHIEKLRLMFPGQFRLWSAFEVPFLDICGKATSRSVSDLLGGAVRDRVAFAAYLFYKFGTPQGWYDTPAGAAEPFAQVGLSDWEEEVLTPEAMVEEAAQFIQRYGFKSLKLKGGVLSPDEEVRTLELMHERFGSEYKLRIDPNAGWSVETALAQLPRLERIGLEYYEDPVRGMDAMAEVGRATEIPMATNMCLTRFPHFPEAVAKDAVQVVLADHHGWGGLQAMKDCGLICQVFGIGTSQHSNSHAGISMAAMIHAGATVPHMTYASDTHYPWQQGWDIVNETFAFDATDGTLAVPKGPGLGVTLNEDRLARLAEIAKARGTTARDDLAVMKRWFPDWERKTTRW
jgi:glucarate dehydratase